MNNKEQTELADSLLGYKENINSLTRSTLTWDRELIFTGRTQEGYEIDFDARVQWGCKPTDALLLSLAGCMGIDTVMFLQKMKVQLSSFRIHITGERKPTPPQHVTAVNIILHIGGKDLNRKKVERAVSLSREKYCSVYNSLRDDLDVTLHYVLEDRGLHYEPV